MPIRFGFVSLPSVLGQDHHIVFVQIGYFARVRSQQTTPIPDACDCAISSEDNPLDTSLLVPMEDWNPALLICSGTQ